MNDVAQRAYSYRETAHMLGVSIRTIERRVAAGQVHVTRALGIPRVPATEIRRLLQAGPAPASTDAESESIARDMIRGGG